MAAKVKRGDLIIIHNVTRAMGITDDAFRVGVVTSVTRDGAPRMWRPVGSERPVKLDCYAGYGGFAFVPATVLDVAAALEIAKAHHYAGYPNQIKPYDSMLTLQAALRPALRKATS